MIHNMITAMVFPTEAIEYRDIEMIDKTSKVPSYSTSSSSELLSSEDELSLDESFFFGCRKRERIKTISRIEIVGVSLYVIPHVKSIFFNTFVMCLSYHNGRPYIII